MYIPTSCKYQSKNRNFRLSSKACSYLQVAMAGDFILAVASMMIARLRNNDVTLVLSQVRP